jgi:hypothetical protein
MKKLMITAERTEVPIVKKFINDILVPYINTVYIKDEYHQSLQVVWGNNYELVKQLDISDVPRYIEVRNGTYNNVVESRKQLREFADRDQEIVQESLLLRQQAVDSCHDDLDKMVAQQQLENNPVNRAIENGGDPIVTEPEDDDVEQKRLAMIEAVRLSSGLSQNYRKL